MAATPYPRRHRVAISAIAASPHTSIHPFPTGDRKCRNARVGIVRTKDRGNKVYKDIYFYIYIHIYLSLDTGRTNPVSDHSR